MVTAAPSDAVADLLSELDAGDALTRNFAAECVAQHRLECVMLLERTDRIAAEQGIERSRTWLAEQLERLLGWAREHGRIPPDPEESLQKKTAA